MIKANKGEEKLRVAFSLLLLCGKLLSVGLSPLLPSQTSLRPESIPTSGNALCQHRSISKTPTVKCFDVVSTRKPCWQEHSFWSTASLVLRTSPGTAQGHCSPIPSPGLALLAAPRHGNVDLQQQGFLWRGRGRGPYFGLLIESNTQNSLSPGWLFQR